MTNFQISMNVPKRVTDAPRIAATPLDPTLAAAMLATAYIWMGSLVMTSLNVQEWHITVNRIATTILATTIAAVMLATG